MAKAALAKTTPLRSLPSVSALLRTESGRRWISTIGTRRVTAVAREVTEQLRSEVRKPWKRKSSKDRAHTPDSLLAEATARLELACQREASPGLRHVINCTGVILHTNLGRAPLCETARRAITEEAARYCTLEYDLGTGARGRRAGRVEKLLIELTNAESALVVNNCAAAALLILSVLARKSETIVSRGELVEIGGDFRVPDVMAASGTRMVEVGTTNRTRLSDYRKAMGDKTRLIMRVHTSNYRIIGFTKTPSLAELAELAHNTGLYLYEDAGSGALLDFTEYGLSGEPLIADSIAAGADVVSFSGDKLLGGPQAGLIVGRSKVIDSLRRHPLYRALRPDKLVLAALEATLTSHCGGSASRDLPALRMIALSRDDISERAEAFLSRLAQAGGGLVFELIDGESAIGGGSAPTTHPKTRLIALKDSRLSAEAIEKALRRSNIPIIARIAEDRVLIDLRTVAEDEEEDLFQALTALSSSRSAT